MYFSIISIGEYGVYFYSNHTRISKESKKNALVAQWIEHLVAVQRVAGSIPAKRTIERSEICVDKSLVEGISCQAHNGEKQLERLFFILLKKRYATIKI